MVRISAGGGGLFSRPDPPATAAGASAARRLLPACVLERGGAGIEKLGLPFPLILQSSRGP